MGFLHTSSVSVAKGAGRAREKVELIKTESLLFLTINSHKESFFLHRRGGGG